MWGDVFFLHSKSPPPFRNRPSSSRLPLPLPFLSFPVMWSFLHLVTIVSSKKKTFDRSRKHRQKEFEVPTVTTFFKNPVIVWLDSPCTVTRDFKYQSWPRRPSHFLVSSNVPLSTFHQTSGLFTRGPPLTELQTRFKVKFCVSVHETLDKLLTESVSPLWVYPILDRPVMWLTYRNRTGQEHDLEG